MIYRVIIKISYNEAWFDFETAEEATIFASQALIHNVENEDSRKQKSVRMEFVNPEVKEEEE